MINPSTFEVEAIEYELRANSKNPDDTITTINNPIFANKIINNNIAPVINPPNKSSSLTYIESPFIFQLSRHIDRKKKRMYGIRRL